MAIDREATLKNAEKFLRIGHLDAAITEYALVVEAAIDPVDLSARLAGARALERAGDMPGAALRYRELFDEFKEKDREGDAAAALQDCVRCDPSMRDTEMLVSVAAIELRARRLEPARMLLAEALTVTSSSRDRVIDLAWSLAGTDVEAAALCVDVVADAWIATGQFAEAAAILREFATRVPARIGTLLRLVEVSVDGGLESTMYESQAQLADAYLAADRAEEARVIAEDLVTREPEEISHVERLRTALTMLGVEDVEGAVAARMSALPTDRVELFDDFPEFAEIATLSSIKSAEDLAPPADEPTADVVAPAREPSAEVDLTTLLGDLESQPEQSQPTAAPERPAPDLENVFATMRYVAAAGVEADESAEHLALARSYMEMGQLDEAVGPLQIASRSPQYRFTAAAALGQIFRDQSDLPRAIEWFERAVETAAPSADEGRAVLYDLGDVLETIGETSRALAVFLELAADAPDFRDVGRRVTNLSSAEMEG